MPVSSHEGKIEHKIRRLKSLARHLRYASPIQLILSCYLDDGIFASTESFFEVDSLLRSAVRSAQVSVQRDYMFKYYKILYM